MTTERYQGWENYETWAVKLWMDNEEGTYLYWRETAQTAWDLATADLPFTRDERAALDLADDLKEWHEEQLPEVAGFVGDLLQAAFSEVNWMEIAKSLLEDVDKEEVPE